MRAAALIAAALAVAAPAAAQWVEHTTAWQAQGLQSDSDLGARPRCPVVLLAGPCCARPDAIPGRARGDLRDPGRHRP